MNPDDEDDARKPIFFAWTRSFWFGLFPAILTVIDGLFVAFADPGMAQPVGQLLAVILGAIAMVPGLDFLAFTADQIHGFMVGIAPLYALIVGHQRMHAARPYTIDPRALK